ncbi:UMTA methyltransferase family [Fusarium denticulatum]|uniref:UMTA methyltransferase family n=1 Tax=Fusarium denticulatum TaxID=48507 RepID=A0A8H5XAG0_9HYPO|nr:UMTA methyltransferase family [Fusarium denticulatum]
MSAAAEVEVDDYDNESGYGDELSVATCLASFVARLIGVQSPLKWPALVRRIYHHLNPSGWVEFQETANTLYSDDGTLEPNNALVRLMHNLKIVHDKIGRTLDPAPEFKNWVSGAGFHDIKEQRFKFPVGLWPRDSRLKEIGALLSVNFTESVDAFTAKPFRDHLGWSQNEVEVMKAEVRKEAKRWEVHAMFDLVVVTAQKPDSE